MCDLTDKFDSLLITVSCRLRSTVTQNCNVSHLSTHRLLEKTKADDVFIDTIKKTNLANVMNHQELHKHEAAMGFKI